MKEWFSAQELADLKLPALPTAKKNILASAARENWKSRAREGRGGGKEYHISALPEVARIQLAVMTAPAAKKEAVKTEINPQGLAEYAHIEGRAKSRIDAKLEILEAFKEFQKSLGFANTRARYIFAEKYNAGEVNLPDWVSRTIISVSACTLRNWTEVLADKGVSGLAAKERASSTQTKPSKIIFWARFTKPRTFPAKTSCAVCAPVSKNRGNACRPTGLCRIGLKHGKRTTNSC